MFGVFIKAVYQAPQTDNPLPNAPSPLTRLLLWTEDAPGSSFWAGEKFGAGQSVFRSAVLELVGAYMEKLRTILEKAEANGKAIGHFNISDLITLKAVFEAAQSLNVPVIVGASEGEREFIGVRQVAAIVKSLREEFPIFLNADHTHSLSSALQAAKAGFDWIVFDLSALPLEDNVGKPKRPSRL